MGKTKVEHTFMLDFVTYDGNPETLPVKDERLIFLREAAHWSRDYPHYGIISAMYWCRPMKGDLWAYWLGPRPAACLLGRSLFSWREREKLIPREVTKKSGGVLTEERIRAIELCVGKESKPTEQEHAAIVALIWPDEQLAEAGDGDN